MVLVGGKSSPLIGKKIINQQSIRSGLLSTKLNLQYLVWIYYLFLTFAFVTQKGIPILTVIDKRIIISKNMSVCTQYLWEKKLESLKENVTPPSRQDAR